MAGLEAKLLSFGDRRYDDRGMTGVRSYTYYFFSEQDLEEEDSEEGAN